MDPRAVAVLVVAVVAAGAGLVALAPDEAQGVASAGGSDRADVTTARGTVEITANAGAGGFSATADGWTAVESPLGNVTRVLVEAVYDSETSPAGGSGIGLTVRTTEPLNETTLTGEGEVVTMRVAGAAFEHRAGADLRLLAYADEGSLVVDETVDVHVTLFRDGRPDWDRRGWPAGG